jgi:hypothetical protein
MTKIKGYLSFIKFSHTIFAMPFALIGCPIPVPVLAGLKGEYCSKINEH